MALLASGLAAGCVVGSERSPVPANLFATARVENLEHARFWGDVVTPEIRSIIARQYEQTRHAVEAGQRSGSAVRRADFLAISGGGSDGAFAAGYLVGGAPEVTDRSSKS